MTSTSWQTSSVSTLTDAVEHRVVGEQVGRDEQLGEVALALEHERHGAVPVAAVVREQQRVRLALGVAAARGCRRADPRRSSRVVWLTTSVSMTPRLASARISG